jgi:hypothetical protein
MGDNPSRRTLGDYGIGTHRCLITHGFQPANPVAFNIKNSVLAGLRENQYGGSLQDPYEHLSLFYESCLFCCPDGVTEDQKKLQLFALTLTGRAKDWLHALPNGTIQKWDELEEKFLKRFFPLSKLLKKRAEISGFKQGDTESLYDAWERFRLLLKRCPPHGFDLLEQMQIFTNGMNVQTRMLLDASAGGSIREKTDLEVQTLIEIMAQNECCVEIEQSEIGVLGVNENSIILASQALMSKQIEALSKQVQDISIRQVQQTQQAQVLRCEFCGEGHANGECVPEGVSEEAIDMRIYQEENPYSNTYNMGWTQNIDLKYSNNNTLNPITYPSQQQPQTKPTALEEALTSFIKLTQTNFQEIKSYQERVQRDNEAYFKNLETQIGQLSKLMATQSRGGFGGNTSNNQKNDACNMIGMSDGRVAAILMRVDKSKKKKVECESKKEGDKIEKLIDASSILRKSKSQLLKDGDKPQVIPYYVKLPYPHFSKNKENVEYSKNKNGKGIELRTRKVLKPVNLESTNRKVDEVDSEDEVGNEQQEKNKSGKRMLVESKWKYPP